jgi:hypothetical protein
MSQQNDAKCYPHIGKKFHIHCPVWHNVPILFSFLLMYYAFYWSVPQHRQAVAGLWVMGPGFNISAVRAVLVTDKVTLVEWFRFFFLPFIVPRMFHIHQSSGTAIMSPSDAEVPRDSIWRYSYSRKKYWSRVIVNANRLLWVTVAVVLFCLLLLL